MTPGDYVVIEVSDNGAGIPPEIVSHIFEPFYTTKEQGKGTGLGLSMTFGFVKQSSGHITVNSEVGRGTAFRLYLPRTQAGATEANVAARFAALEGGRGEAPQGGNETVLVVEDIAPLRRIAVQQLKTLGYRVREAEDAAAALQILATEGAVDLLFSDVVMPGTMHGLELAREVTRIHPGTKVLLTSGFPRTSSTDQQLLVPEFRLLRKPYIYHELAQAVRAALDDREEAPAALDGGPENRPAAATGTHTDRETETRPA